MRRNTMYLNLNSLNYSGIIILQLVYHSKIFESLYIEEIVENYLISQCLRHFF